MGWFCGLKLVFNHRGEIVALKLTPGNVHDTTLVPELTQGLVGKLFGDKGYLGKELAAALLARSLALITRVRKNMRSLSMMLADKTLLNGRNIAETIIGHIKEFSVLNSHATAPPLTYSFTSSPPSPPINSAPSNPKIHSTSLPHNP
jgi:Transposase DDE domain